MLNKFKNNKPSVYVKGKYLLPKCENPNCNCRPKLCVMSAINGVDIKQEYDFNVISVEMMVSFFYYSTRVDKNKKINNFFQDNFTKLQQDDLSRKIFNITPVTMDFIDLADRCDIDFRKLFEKIVIQFIINCNSNIISDIKII
jgi:hypothetical protein